MTDYLGLLRLDGRVALVTGGGAGIGRATCHALAQAGAQVAVTDIDQAAADRVAGEIARGEAHGLDVADESAVGVLVEAVAARHGRIDILVNNAGLGARMATVELPTERWRQVHAVNLDGSFFCVRAVGRSHAGCRAGGRRQSRLDHGPGRRRPLPEPRLPQRQGRARQLHPRARL